MHETSETHLAEAKEVLIKSIQTEIKRREWTQHHAAKVLQCTQPRMSTLMNNKSENFSFKSLTEMIVRLGGIIQYNITYPDQHDG